MVLITTGGFSPLHDGHIRMMEEAKKILEKEGFGVCGGYISPSHDSYVLKKHEGTSCLEKRVEQIEGKIIKSDWLMCDLWEGVYNPTAINFTDVIERTEGYLRRWFSKEVKVIYVFGSDNQFFLEAFRHRGGAVCIKRENNLDDSLKQIVDNKRVFFIEPKKDFSKYSSRSMKKEKDTGKRQGPMLVRNDLSISFNKDGKEALNLIKKYYKNIKELPEKYQVDFSPSISLDVWTKGDYNIEITRDFFLADIQQKGFRLNNRIGAKKIKDQIKQIPAGKYILFDDDIASGQTMNLIKKEFPKKIKIETEESLLKKVWAKPFLDVVDLRDFFFGAKEGGLTVILPNNKRSRVPYIAPFVNLNTRASLDYKDSLNFSLDILILNLKYLKGVRVGDLPKNQRNLFYFMGYKDPMMVEEFLKKQVKFLQNIT